MKMFCVDIHVLIQVMLYFCIFICGFLVSISVGLIKNGFDGACIFYGKAITNQHFLIVSEAACDFPMYFAIVGMILAALFLGIYYAYGLFQSIKVSDYGSKMMLLPLIPLNGTLCLMTLVVACMLTAGFYQFCNSFEAYGRRCIDNDVHGPYVTRNILAQAGAWLGFLFYLAQTGLCVLRLHRNRTTVLSHPTNDMTKDKVSAEIGARKTIV